MWLPPNGFGFYDYGPTKELRAQVKNRDCHLSTGTVQELTVSTTPQQNAVSERDGRTLSNMVWFLQRHLLRFKAADHAIDQVAQDGMPLEQLQKLRELVLGENVEVFRWRLAGGGTGQGDANARQVETRSKSRTASAARVCSKEAPVAVQVTENLETAG